MAEACWPPPFFAEKALLLKQPRSGTEAGEISQQDC